MPEVIGIDHIYLTVSDLARAEAFYTTVLQGVLGYRSNRFTLAGDPHVQFYNRHHGIVLRPARPDTPQPAHNPDGRALGQISADIEAAVARLDIGGADEVGGERPLPVR